MLTPIAAAFYGASPAGLPLRVVVVGVVFWLAAAVTLHLTARWVLGGLQPWLIYSFSPSWCCRSRLLGLLDRGLGRALLRLLTAEP